LDITIFKEKITILKNVIILKFLYLNDLQTGGKTNAQGTFGSAYICTIPSVMAITETSDSILTASVV
jgi:hypothetical protein